jgi:hypothetical protein
MSIGSALQLSPVEPAPSPGAESAVGKISVFQNGFSVDAGTLAGVLARN